MIKGFLDVFKTCTEEEVKHFRVNCPEVLPREYIDFICENHRVTGDLPVNPYFFRLWEVSKVLEMNTDYQVAEYVPRHFGIGDNGGGEMLTICYADKKIYAIPFAPMEDEDKMLCFEDFDDFVKHMGWMEDEE